MSNRHAESAWQAMRTLLFELNDRRGAVSAELGLSFIRVKAVRLVAKEPLTMRELGAHLAIDPPYTTVVVDDLETRGLVERRPDAGDRRRKIVAATPEGVQLAERARRMLDVPPDAFAALPAGDLAELDRIMQSLLAASATGLAEAADAAISAAAAELAATQSEVRA